MSATFADSVSGSVRYTERKQRYRDARLSIKKKDTMSGLKEAELQFPHLRNERGGQVQRCPHFFLATEPIVQRGSCAEP